MLYPPITPSSPDYVPDRGRFKHLNRQVSHMADNSRRRLPPESRSNGNRKYESRFRFPPENRLNGNCAEESRWSTTSDTPLPMILEDPPVSRSSSPRNDGEVICRGEEGKSTTAHCNPAFVPDEDITSADEPFEKSDSVAIADESSSKDIVANGKPTELPLNDTADLSVSSNQSSSQIVDNVSEVKIHVDDDKDVESGLGCSPSPSSSSINEQIEGESDQESNVLEVSPGRRKSSISAIVANISMITVPKPTDVDNETLL